ncbi:hypothetical protein J8273_1650 [Carpediemonas membranifera]|uniref:Uncharacterized protein n=1 Tax=Carpediemonas membranifera TaxID=201153 RepID=A0A8J6B6E3_9EUKA|nr:hypothetical protein J8273_1650 [Carpediemonas membranifera]|eukprot:KAG9396633.1 hypothetical protein J8273_1650 [Carpediemonas membranifera]
MQLDNPFLKTVRVNFGLITVGQTYGRRLNLLKLFNLPVLDDDVPTGIEYTTTVIDDSSDYEVHPPSGIFFQSAEPITVGEVTIDNTILLTVSPVSHRTSSFSFTIECAHPSVPPVRVLASGLAHPTVIKEDRNDMVQMAIEDNIDNEILDLKDLYDDIMLQMERGQDPTLDDLVPFIPMNAKDPYGALTALRRKLMNMPKHEGRHRMLGLTASSAGWSLPRRMSGGSLPPAEAGPEALEFTHTAHTVEGMIFLSNAAQNAENPGDLRYDGISGLGWAPFHVTATLDEIDAAEEQYKQDMATYEAEMHQWEQIQAEEAAAPKKGKGKASKAPTPAPQPVKPERPEIIDLRASVIAANARSLAARDSNLLGQVLAADSKRARGVTQRAPLDPINRGRSCLFESRAKLFTKLRDENASDQKDVIVAGKVGVGRPTDEPPSPDRAFFVQQLVDQYTRAFARSRTTILTPALPPVGTGVIETPLGFDGLSVYRPRFKETPREEFAVRRMAVERFQRAACKIIVQQRAERRLRMLQVALKRAKLLKKKLSTNLKTMTVEPLPPAVDPAAFLTDTTIVVPKETAVNAVQAMLRCDRPFATPTTVPQLGLRPVYDSASREARGVTAVFIPDPVVGLEHDTPVGFADWLVEGFATLDTLPAL